MGSSNGNGGLPPELRHQQVIRGVGVAEDGDELDETDDTNDNATDTMTVRDPEHRPRGW